MPSHTTAVVLMVALLMVGVSNAGHYMRQHPQEQFWPVLAASVGGAEYIHSVYPADTQATKPTNDIFITQEAGTQAPTY